MGTLTSQLDEQPVDVALGVVQMRRHPHVTLAHRMTADQVAVALSVVRGPRVADGYAVGVRRWDGDARREWLLAGAG